SGKDGALEQVDRAAARSRSGNTFAAWREVTPAHNKMVDTILRARLHVIATMRAKTEYIIEQVTRNGRTVHEPRKIGLAPVQRDGLEYEFDVVADMDWDHRFIVSKSRASFLADAVLDKPGPELGEQIRAWLDTGEAAAPASAPSPAAERVTTADAHAAALAAYHDAAATKLPNEQDRKDFLRYAAWKMAASKYADGKGPAPVLPASTKDVPIGTISSIVKRVVDLDGEALLSLLNEWRREHAETEDAVPDVGPVRASREVVSAARPRTRGHPGYQPRHRRGGRKTGPMRRL